MTNAIVRTDRGAVMVLAESEARKRSPGSCLCICRRPNLHVSRLASSPAAVEATKGCPMRHGGGTGESESFVAKHSSG